MKMNKKETTEMIMQMAGDQIRSCKKLEMQNIIFPKWEDIGLLGMIFRQNVITKEQPQGHLYDEATYQVVMRIINGRVLMTGGQPDCYTWKHSKVDKLENNAKPIGTNSEEGLINLYKLISVMKNDEDVELLISMFAKLKVDLKLVTSPAEDRRCIEVTQELYDNGLTFCVDEWMGDTDEVTELNVGDFLIVSSNNDSVYCIRRDEFLATHELM